MPNHFEELEVCKRKVQYSSSEAADRAAKNHTSRQGSPKHRAYQCPACFMWHLATKK